MSKPAVVARLDQYPAVAVPIRPEHNWCYYYTKAELARQRNDWESINRLFSEAASLGYEAGEPFEWLVFIEAQAMTGSIKSAKELSYDTFEEDRRTRKGLCQVWKRVQQNLPENNEKKTELQALFAELQCGRYSLKYYSHSQLDAL